MSCNSKGGANRACESTKDAKESEEEHNSNTKKMVPEKESTERENFKRRRSYSDEEYFKRQRIAPPIRRSEILSHAVSQESSRTSYPRYFNRVQTERQSAPFEEMVSTQIRRSSITGMPGSFIDDMMMSRPEMGIMNESARAYEELRRNNSAGDLHFVDQ